MRKQFRDLISVEEAERIVRNLPLTVGTETVPLVKADGRTLAEDVKAEHDVPPFPRSTMDGYAVRAQDTYGAEEQKPVALTYLGSVEAGEESDVAVEENGCVEIATGAVLPENADAVVMVERTDREGDEVLVRRAVAPDENVMKAGADIPKGHTPFRAGTLLGPRELGGLAAVGTDAVKVRRKPRVAIISTGDELVPPGDTPGRSQIHDINSYVLLAALREAGCDPDFLGIARDDESEMRRIVEEAESYDLALSSGSTSAGAGDMMYRVVEERGELVAHGVKLKPGKPTVIARLGDTPFIGLPGNPASSYGVYKKLVDPWLRHHTGIPLSETVVNAVMGKNTKSTTGRHQLRFVTLTRQEGHLVARPVEKGSGAVTLLIDADGYVEVPEGVSRLDEGEEVEVTLLTSTP